MDFVKKNSLPLPFLEKKITVLTLEEKIDLVEAAYILWVQEDLQNDDYTFISQILRGNGFKPFNSVDAAVIKYEFEEIYTSQYDPDSGVTTVGEMINAVFEDAYWIKDILKWKNNGLNQET